MNLSISLTIRCACFSIVFAITSASVYSQEAYLSQLTLNSSAGTTSRSDAAYAPMLLNNWLTSPLQSVVNELQGTRYRFGGNSIENGLDCSGLVRQIWMRLGLKALPRQASEMATIGPNIETSDLKPGDLVFFNTLGKAYSHVGVYIGLDRFVHASSVQGKVTENSLKDRYYTKIYNGARRPAIMPAE